MSYISDIYTPEQTSPTLTDRYHFTTGYGYWLEGRAANPSISYMFGRKEAESGGYTVEAGIEGIIDVVKRWKAYGLTAEDREWLTNEGYPREYINFLHDLLINDCPIQMDVVKTRLFFPQEPVLRIKAPIIVSKMLESPNLCIENGQSAYATHAARLVEALEMDMESGAPKGSASIQGLRRGPSLGAALEASRGLAYGGYKSTSTGRAAELQGVKFAGTMDHAWVQTHDYQMNKASDAATMADLFSMRDEGRIEELQNALSKDAFRSYAFANPDNGIFLTDTFDTLIGIEDAITVIKELRTLGHGKNFGMRFDSGDLLKFSEIALRRIADRCDGDLLDALPQDKDPSQFTHKELLQYAGASTDAPFCAASDTITVLHALDMRQKGAYVKSWGVGTAGSHAPPLGLVQKVSAMYMTPLNGNPMPENERLTPTSKIVSSSPAKSSNPGNINSRRFYDDNGKLSHIVIYDEDLGFDREGKIVNLRDFDDVKTNPGGARSEDILEPVFDKNGRYVYQESAKKPAHTGSSFMVTDLGAIAEEIKEELKTLPDDVRKIQKPREAVLAERLMNAFKKAKEEGSDIALSIAELEKDLPTPQGHISVYLDNLLYQQRLECENRHHAHAKNSHGVERYVERFEV